MMVKRSTIYTICLSLCFCQAVIVKISPIYFQNYTIVLRIFLVLGLIMLFPGIKYYLYEKKYFLCNVLIYAMVGSIMLSAIMNKNSYTGSIWVAVTFSLQMIFLMWYCQYLDLSGHARLGIKCLYILIAFYCILSDVLMVVDPHRTFFEWGGHTDMYFVGEKFNVTYLHFLLVVLYFLLNKKKLSKKRLKTTGMVVWLLIVSVYSECSTMVAGTILFILLMCFGKKINNILLKPLFSVIFLVLCDTILILNYSLTQVPAVKMIIENILNETTDLTGRVNIYAKTAMIMNANPLYGVGIDNNYEVSMRLTHAADVQNGILDIILSYGWIGVIILFVFLMYVIKQSQKNDNKVTIYAIYVYIALSIVEITFRQGMYIYFLLTLLCSWSIERRNNE